ncbi:response regulator [Pseudobacteriovorax antillogorgiicola]|uniref:Tetratricopeptide repeat-containing protein n=1 Tax=Pseudobacteriovorax antillogorgiicola TaxID=1513793 RepID=A0A1Y6CE11_9BACT|nr:response regulator [Pseudobacteriovorax antillogorgiicola]TCS51750.1 tetratricopeptide repeat protein [Pseudobacteriovorax antillogorgiicola]SMF49699.1 Tetratricopeptide repeat-containing protein [Pseudobacteriovorax antillogorgiicola]
MLHDKERARLLLVEPASTVRQMISDVLKDMGFNNIMLASKGKDALHILEVETVDWLITSTLINDDVNFIHLLDIIVKQPELRRVRTSVLIESDTEEYVLPLAFELGLFSWHRKAYVKENIVGEFEDLFSLFSIKKKSDILTSAEYLRKYLDESRSYRNRLIFEQNLLSLFPGSSQCLLALAEAQKLNDREKDALLTLQQVEILNPKLKPLCDRIRNSIDASLDTALREGKAQNCLSLKRCVVIDSDTDALHHISELLSHIGGKSIECFEDGDTAFLSLKQQPEPSAIFMEWRVPGITGPVLIQRIRNHGLSSVPIIIVSSLVDKQDVNLIKEMGVDDLLHKPFESDKFYATLIWCIQQNRKPSEQRSYELKIQRLLDQEKFAEAERLSFEFLKDPRINNIDKIAVQAQLKFVEGDFKKVVNLCFTVLKQRPEDLKILNLLGKTYLKLSRFEKALLCFDKAQKLSPANIKRLIDIADINLELGKDEDFEGAVQKAKEIDGESELVKQVDCRLALEKGETATSRSLFKEIDHLPSIVRDMNNRAVALARNGRYEDGINLYQNTLVSFNKDHQELHKIVSYNLAMAYARYGDLVKAESTLASLGDGDFGIYKKIKSLLAKVKVCLQEGRSLTFNTSFEELHQSPVRDGEAQDEEQELVDIDQELSSLTNALQAQQGDICCHLLFFDVQGLCMEAEKLRDNGPHFKLRQAIGKVV